MFAPRRQGAWEGLKDTKVMADSIRYMLHSGKNNKALYYLKNYIDMLVPDCLYRRRLGGRLAELDSRPDRDYVSDRVAYYCKLAPGASLPDEAEALGDQRVGRQKVYYFDTRKYCRWFPKDMKWMHISGDVDFTPEWPSVVKSRPVGDDNANGVLMKLNAVRHFIFVKDRLSFAEKESRAVFRGKVVDKPLRVRFFEKYFGNPLCDLGDISRRQVEHPEWRTKKMTIGEHLKYKFILSLEGNDVASNLKWVMSSNSLAVMTRPKFETWYMEGRLVPGVHYVEIRDDFSDLEEKMAYYSANPAEAQKIIDNAHEWVRQFRDKRREELISLLVLERYFKATGQM